MTSPLPHNVKSLSGKHKNMPWSLVLEMHVRDGCCIVAQNDYYTWGLARSPYALVRHTIWLVNSDIVDTDLLAPLHFEIESSGEKVPTACMNLFSRKPSRETGLQRIYTEAYQSSLQSILKESSFEFSESLDSWKQTLAQITAGMALLDGSPPKTGQEKSLLASIMDIERQCHDRISSLELRLRPSTSVSQAGQVVHQSPYGTYVSNTSSTQLSELSLNEKSRKAHRVAVGTKAPRIENIKSEPSLVNITNQTSPVSTIKPVPESTEHPTTPVTTSPALDFTDQFVSHMPRVSEMPYDLYSRKSSSIAPQQTLSTRSAPALPSEQASSKKQKEQQLKQSQQLQIQHRSSLDYPQPSPAHGHSMLTTLRSKNPLRGRKKSSGSPAQPSPSPRSSAESIALTAAKQTAAAAAPHKQESPNLHQFSGFEGTFASDSQPSSPLFDTDQGGHSRHSSTASYGNGPEVSSQATSKNSSQQSLQPAFRPPQHSQHQTHNSSAGKKSQFQVAYDKIPTASGKIVYRPRVVRTTAGAPAPSNSAHNHPGHNHTSSSSKQISHRSSQAQILADGKPEGRNESDETEEMDDWDKMVQQKIKELRGVDKAAAQQIVNEVVLKGDHVNWDDIAGLDKAKASLKETVVYPFLRPDLFMGLREPVLGMLLFGPPGTGKTMLARAVATESKSTFFSISASSLTSKYMGESEKLVRALFQLAKALAPAIIFVDEIDSILTQRADSGEHEASRRIKNEFLVQWSDLQAAAAGKSNQDSEAKRVLVLGATNLPWAIDEAARRRFVRRQYIPLPEAFTRRVHLEKLLSHQKHALTDQDLNELVALTDGYSGSDLTALAKDAAMGPLRSLGDALLTTAQDQIRSMGMGDFVDSMRSIRPSVSPEGLRAFEQWANMYGSSGA